MRDERREREKERERERERDVGFSLCVHLQARQLEDMIISDDKEILRVFVQVVRVVVIVVRVGTIGARTLVLSIILRTAVCSCDYIC